MKGFTKDHSNVLTYSTLGKFEKVEEKKVNSKILSTLPRPREDSHRNETQERESSKPEPQGSRQGNRYGGTRMTKVKTHKRPIKVRKVGKGHNHKIPFHKVTLKKLPRQPQTPETPETKQVGPYTKKHSESRESP